MERIVRRLLDLPDLIHWCQIHSVALVSATEAFLDLTAPFGDVVALLVAKVAEMELAAISERNRSAAQHKMKEGKYRGGPPPWGYMTEKVDGDWRFVQDDEQVKVINEVVRRVLDGEPLRQVAAELTERAVLTPRDRVNQFERPGDQGIQLAFRQAERNADLQIAAGARRHSQRLHPKRQRFTGRPRYPDTGTRSIRAGTGRACRPENRKEPTRRSSAVLLRVIYCGVCGKPAYKLKGGRGRQDRYRCASAQYKATCGNRTVAIADADEVLTDAVMFQLGDKYRRDRVWDAGSDHSAELVEIEDTLTDLTDQLGTGAFRKGTPQRERLDARIADLAQRQAQLTTLVTRPAGWTWVPTEEPFRDWWDSQTIEQRNVWLRQMEVRMTWDQVGPHVEMLHLERMAAQWE